MLAGLALSCAAGPTPPPPKSVLVIENHSQFELQQLYVHRAIDDYRSQPNLLSSPLAVMGQIILREPTISNGSCYVTVVRRKSEVGVLVGDLVAVTTASPIDLQGGTCVLWVFDQSFRLWKPVPIADSGVGDLGGERRRSDLGRPDGARTDAPRSDGARSDIPQDDAARTDASRSDATSLDRQPKEAQ